MRWNRVAVGWTSVEKSPDLDFDAKYSVTWSKLCLCFSDRLWPIAAGAIVGEEASAGRL